MLDTTASDLPTPPPAPPGEPIPPPIPVDDPVGDPPPTRPPLNSLFALQNYRFVGFDPRMNVACDLQGDLPVTRDCGVDSVLRLLRDTHRRQYSDSY